MSNASTVAHYIKVACRESGRPLDGECQRELEAALEGMVEEAVDRAVAAIAQRTK